MAATALLLTGCIRADPYPMGAAPLDPIAFFTGTTRGEGTLDPIIGKSVRVTVESQGTPTSDGLRLVQTIREGAKPPRVRTWLIRRNADGTYGGTLTDAAGPVEMTSFANGTHVRYRTRGGIEISQVLALQADGRTVLNRLHADRFGLRLATLDETIRR